MRMSRKEEKKKKTRERLHKCFASHRIKNLNTKVFSMLVDILKQSYCLIWTQSKPDQSIRQWFTCLTNLL